MDGRRGRRKIPPQTSKASNVSVVSAFSETAVSLHRPSPTGRRLVTRQTKRMRGTIPEAAAYFQRYSCTATRDGKSGTSSGNGRSEKAVICFEVLVRGER